MDSWLKLAGMVSAQWVQLVSILVLMDSWLKRDPRYPLILCDIVSILVLMDSWLKLVYALALPNLLDEFQSLF